MAPKKRRSKLSKGKAVADRADDKELKKTAERGESKRDTECYQGPSKRKNVRVASSLTPAHEDGCRRERKTNDSTPGVLRWLCDC
jgi:hypothetical protein